MAYPTGLRAILLYCRAVVWTASLLVPAQQRHHWRTERNRHFWHWCLFLFESGQFDSENRRVIARTCWQLFPEVFWLRYDRDLFLSTKRKVLGSPVSMLAALLLVIVSVTLASSFVPAVRLAVRPHVPDPDRVVTISLDGNGINGKYSRTRSDTLFDLAEVWQKSTLASGLAPFSWSPGSLLLSSRDLPVGVARVGSNFFDTVGVKPYVGRTFDPADTVGCPACVVVLSYSVWRYELRADPNIVGKDIVLNGSRRVVIGVLPPSFRMVSPGIAAWVLMDPALLFTNFQRRVGAVAKLSAGSTTGALQRDLTDRTESAGYVHPASRIQVLTAAEQQRRSLSGTLWFTLLAIGSAIFVVLLRNASQGIGGMPHGAGVRALWLSYYIVKSVLALALAALLTWATVHWLSLWLFGSSNPVADEYAIWLFLALAMIALSWSVSDQKNRCRVCLQRLELPVEIGRTGSVLLNWAGTELVCPQGHGVLYLPESAANSLDHDRWSKMDDSWDDLFRT